MERVESIDGNKGRTVVCCEGKQASTGNRRVQRKEITTVKRKKKEKGNLTRDEGRHHHIELSSQSALVAWPRGIPSSFGRHVPVWTSMQSRVRPANSALATRRLTVSCLELWKLGLSRGENWRLCLAEVEPVPASRRQSETGVSFPGAQARC